MSAPLSSLFHGDINIEQGYDTSSYGFGDLSVNRKATIGAGTVTNSTNASTGSLIVFGGVGITQDSNLDGILTVNSTSNLQTTFIDTTLGVFSVSGGNAVTMSVGGAVSITSTAGNSSFISTNNNTIIQGGINAFDAVQITATNGAGGVSILSGATGQLALTAGSGGIQGMTSAGNINLTANNGSTSFIVNSSAGNQNLTLAQFGATDSGVIISASGDNTTNTAIQITTTNTGGNISINNNGGLGTGSITTLTGSGGYTLTTNTGGPIQITAQAAASYIVVNSTAANQNLTIAVNGATTSSLILESAGTGVSAINIQNTNTAGSILITQPSSSAGGIDLETGSAGLTANTQTGGGINLTANGATSSFINNTDTAGQDLTISVLGGTDSSLILSSNGTANDAIIIQSTGGGITQSASGPVSINSSDNINGINIGTAQLAPVNIGTTTSTTTVYGNLDVRGTTTTFESTVVTIADNILELNAAPSGLSDGGTAIKRYQLANNSGLGAVVSDTFEISDTAQTGATDEITLSASDNQPDNYYNGYWIRILSGTGNDQVRRIKTYTSLTKVATIYNTIDQDGVLNSPIPNEGLDWLTTPDATSVYGLYPCAYIVSMWDESLKEYAIVCSNFVSGGALPTVPIAHYVNLHINNLIANSITVNSINGTTADTQTNFNLTDNLTTPFEITSFPFNYGLYIVLVKPTTAISTRCYGIFVMGRLNASQNGSVARLISVRGTSNEQLDFSWPAGNFPSIFYRPAPGTGGTTNYTIKIISI
jgi:hypothetical protein